MKKGITPDEIAAILVDGGVGVMPTDTIYGLAGSALSKNAVERIYRIKVTRIIILTLYQQQHYFDFLTTRFYSAVTATILDVPITAAVIFVSRLDPLAREEV